MQNNLKLKIKIQGQVITLWEIIKTTDSYLMFRASISSGKKKLDGTWDNVSQTFTCFVNGENISKINDNFSQKKKIIVSGTLLLLPEKRTMKGQNGEYQETIFSNATLNVENITFQQNDINNTNVFRKTENFYEKISKGEHYVPENKYNEIGDNIPF